MLFSDGELLGEEDYQQCLREQGIDFLTEFKKITKKETIWRSFAILPNQEGQKYTLGNTYKSREEQGEFIFWDGETDNSKLKRKAGKKNPAKKETSVCEINVMDKKYWITPLEGNKVRVNDAKIKGKTELKFGDYLTLGEKQKANISQEEWDLWSKPPHPFRFLFKKRDFLKDSSVKRGVRAETLQIPVKRGRRSYKDVDIASSVGLNPLILSKVFPYLPVKNLKNVRLVSKLWNEEAAKLIKKRCVAHFLFDVRGDMPTMEKSQDTMKLFRYALEMRDNPLLNWKIRFPAIGYLRLGHFDGTQEAKLLKDMTWFLSNPFHSIRSLELGGSIVSKFDCDLRIMVLERLHETLEDLILSGEWKTGSQQNDSSIQLRKLKRFTISLEPASGLIFTNSMAKACFITWLNTLLPSVTGVSFLRLAIRDVDVGAFFLSKLESFPNVDELALKRTTHVAMEYLLTCKKSFKKLELNQLEIREGSIVDVANVENLIKIHSQHLECLQFFIPHRDTVVRIGLPVLPKLKKLNVGLLGYCNVNPTCVSLAFPGPGNQINYAQQFPSLQCLTLWPWGEGKKRTIFDIARFWTENYQFFTMFFPSLVEDGIPQVFKTLRSLDIPWEDRDKCVFPRAEELANMFPGVFNKWANMARKPVIPAPDEQTLMKRMNGDSEATARKTPNDSVHAMKLRSDLLPDATAGLD